MNSLKKENSQQIIFQKRLNEVEWTFYEKYLQNLKYNVERIFHLNLLGTSLSLILSAKNREVGIFLLNKIC